MTASWPRSTDAGVTSSRTRSPRRSRAITPSGQEASRTRTDQFIPVLDQIGADAREVTASQDEIETAEIEREGRFTSGRLPAAQAARRGGRQRAPRSPRRPPRPTSRASRWSSEPSRSLMRRARRRPSLREQTEASSEESEEERASSEEQEQEDKGTAPPADSIMAHRTPRNQELLHTEVRAQERLTARGSRRGGDPRAARRRHRGRARRAER